MRRAFVWRGFCPKGFMSRWIRAPPKGCTRPRILLIRHCLNTNITKTLVCEMDELVFFTHFDDGRNN